MLNRIRVIVVPPVFEDEEKTRVARLLHIVLLTLLVVTPLIMGMAALLRYNYPDTDSAPQSLYGGHDTVGGMWVAKPL